MKKNTFRFVPLYSGGMLSVRGHDLPVVLDIAGGKMTAPVESWLDHMPDQKVGTITKVWVGKNSEGRPCVCAEGEFLTDQNGELAPHAREVIAQKKLHGREWEGSIHTMRPLPGDMELLPPGQKLEVNGRVFCGPAEIYRRWTLVEGSFVTVGGDAYNGTEICALSIISTAPDSAQTALAKGNEMPADLKEFIESLGLVPEELDAGVIGALERAFKVMNEKISEVAANVSTPKEPEPPIEAGGANEPPKESEPQPQEVEASGKGGKRNPATQYKSGYVDKMSGAPSLNRAWTAALALSSGILGEKEVAAAGRFTTNEMTEAVSRRYNGVGLRQMLAEAQERRTGRRITGNEAGFALEALKRLMNPGEILASAAYSTMNELTIIQDILQLFYRNGYESFHSVIDKISSTTYANTFFPYKYVSYDVANGASEVPEGGDIPNTTLVSEEYENEVQERSSILTITERMIINDSVGALGKLSRKLGVRQKRQRDQVGLRCVLDNLDTFFTTQRGNRVIRLVNIQGLSTASAALAEMPTAGSTTSEPDFTGEEGKMLLVPTMLKETARTLYADTKCDLVGLGEYLESNPHQGMFEPLSTPYLGSKVPGGNDAYGFLLGDPANGTILDQARLKGESGPRLEDYPTPANIIGKTFRIVDRYGFAMAEWRAGVLIDGPAAIAAAALTAE